MKWIEVTRKFRSGGEQYYRGERLNVDTANAERWIKAGWAKDLTGEISTGAVDTAPKTLAVADGVHDAAGDAAGLGE